jgi:putative tryptophan/tyrosine transport system substrate-binding protein
MRRRDFITFLGGAAVAWPVVARAQKDKKPVYIGFISGLDRAGAAGFIDAFLQGLAAFGYVSPGTLKFDTLFADNALDRIPGLVRAGETTRRYYSDTCRSDRKRRTRASHGSCRL